MYPSLHTAPGAASQEDFLLDEDDPKLRAVLNGMIAAKKEDKQSETASQTKGWVKLHMGLAEKRIAAWIMLVCYGYRGHQDGHPEAPRPSLFEAINAAALFF